MRQKDLRVAEKIYYAQDERYLSYKQNPEEILIDKERNQAIKALWVELKNRLNEKELDYLFAFVANNNKGRETARQFGVDEKNVRYYMNKIQKKAKALLEEIGLTVDDMKDIIRPQINLGMARHSQGVGYPFEKYIALAPGKSWSFRWGKMRLPINKPCMIPEYLKASGCDCVCNICCESDTCKRTDAYPENGETEEQKEHAKLIAKIMRKLQRNYRPQDIAGLEKVANF